MGIVMVCGIALLVMRSSDPAAQGPIVTRPFNPAAVMTPDAIQRRDEALAHLGRGGGAHSLGAQTKQR